MDREGLIEMNDLINRQDAIDAIVAWTIEDRPDIEMPTDLVDRVNALPSAERKGKWLRYGEDGNPNTEDTAIWQCDHCLETYYGRTTKIPKYCPNCGARMDERGEDDKE